MRIGSIFYGYGTDWGWRGSAALPYPSRIRRGGRTRACGGTRPAPPSRRSALVRGLFWHGSPCGKVLRRTSCGGVRWAGLPSARFRPARGTPASWWGSWCLWILWDFLAKNWKCVRSEPAEGTWPARRLLSLNWQSPSGVPATICEKESPASSRWVKRLRDPPAIKKETTTTRARHDQLCIPVLIGHVASGLKQALFPSGYYSVSSFRSAPRNAGPCSAARTTTHSSGPTELFPAVRDATASNLHPSWADPNSHKGQRQRSPSIYRSVLYTTGRTHFTAVATPLHAWWCFLYM